METTQTLTEDTYMFSIETDIIIDAPAQDVWRVLTDFSAYPQWNPFVKSIEGELAVGDRLVVTLHQIKSKPIVVKPRVVEVADGMKFGWLGRLLVPKLFDGEHWFGLEAISETQTRFRQWENFGGLLLPLLRGMLVNKTKPSFELMNQALKERVESQSAG